MNFHKILCPIDFSSGSKQAMHVAAGLAKTCNAELVLAHAWSVPSLAFAGEVGTIPPGEEAFKDDAQRSLDEAQRELVAHGVARISTRLVSGAPPAVLELLDDPSFDLVVVGTHGRTGLRRVLLGSIAEKIVRRAPCSVLVVREAISTFASVLCAVDLSNEAVATMAGSVVERDGTVMLIHVLELPIAGSSELYLTGMYSDADRTVGVMLDSWADRLRGHDVTIETRLRHGSPGGEILGELEHKPRYDLVVMGSHGRTGLARLLLGSVAEKVVRHAPCSVLVARTRE